MRNNREREKTEQIEEEIRNKGCSTRRIMKERRIRLSANTAIEFYDVQDRLGYDRATNAIDWLMKEAKVAIDALDAIKQDNHAKCPIPATATIFNPSGTFHRIPNQNQQNFNHDQTSSFDNPPFGLLNPINRCPQEMNHFFYSKTPLDFALNPNYNKGEGYVFAGREPIHSSFAHPTAHASNNGLLGCSQQELDVHEDEKDNLVVVPGHYFPSDTSGFIKISKDGASRKRRESKEG